MAMQRKLRFSKTDSRLGNTGEFRGVRYEVDKIQNEFWFNVSATPFGPISQEFGAEHNLTYELCPSGRLEEQDCQTTVCRG